MNKKLLLISSLCSSLLIMGCANKPSESVYLESRPVIAVESSVINPGQVYKYSDPNYFHYNNPYTYHSGESIVAVPISPTARHYEHKPIVPITPILIETTKEVKQVSVTSCNVKPVKKVKKVKKVKRCN